MQQYTLKELMVFDWSVGIEDDPDGGVILTVDGLDDFQLYGSDAHEVVADFEEALRSHLKAYLATGKVVPVPRGRIVEAQDTDTMPENRMVASAMTGRVRSIAA